MQHQWPREALGDGVGETEAQYYARRAEEEAQAAERATNERASGIHRLLAAKFAKLAEAEAKRPQTQLRMRFTEENTD